MMTLVIYDISDDDDRGKLANMLFDFGLQRIQYSGFKGELNAHDRHILAKEVGKFKVLPLGQGRFPLPGQEGQAGH